MSPHHPIDEFYGRVPVFEAFGQVSLAAGLGSETIGANLHQFPGIYSRQASTTPHKLSGPSLFGAHWLCSCNASASYFIWGLPGRNLAHVLQDHFVRWTTHQLRQTRRFSPKEHSPCEITHGFTHTPWSGQRGLAPCLCCLAELQGLCLWSSGWLGRLQSPLELLWVGPHEVSSWPHRWELIEQSITNQQSHKSHWE